jgi:hypothetical protein
MEKPLQELSPLQDIITQNNEYEMRIFHVDIVHKVIMPFVYLGYNDKHPYHASSCIIDMCPFYKYSLEGDSM